MGWRECWCSSPSHWVCSPLNHSQEGNADHLQLPRQGHNEHILLLHVALWLGNVPAWARLHGLRILHCATCTMQPSRIWILGSHSRLRSLLVYSRSRPYDVSFHNLFHSLNSSNISTAPSSSKCATDFGMPVSQPASVGTRSVSPGEPGQPCSWRPSSCSSAAEPVGEAMIMSGPQGEGIQGSSAVNEADALPAVHSLTTRASAASRMSTLKIVA
jgi:hypothetical protein